MLCQVNTLQSLASILEWLANFACKMDSSISTLLETNLEGRNSNMQGMAILVGILDTEKHPLVSFFRRS